MYLDTYNSKENVSHEGLRYVSDAKPGFTRMRRGKKFFFFDQHGCRIKDGEIIRRIKSIGIPPAYKSVWISPWANGHIQAIGLDAKGRRQYRYHKKWREMRDNNKFEHILHFGHALPEIRKTVARDLEESDLTREKILATVVSLLEKTLIRISNAEYARQNDSYGLTTLRGKHVNIRGDTIRFHFVGKSGKQWNLSVHDRRIAATIKRCSELPGYDIFKYIGEAGSIHEISSGDVNSYLKEITKRDFTAKDYRTWSGTVLAALALQEVLTYDSQSEAKKNVVAAIEKVAKRLGNTPSICRKCYVHPEIVNAYMSGELAKMTKMKLDAEFRAHLKHLSRDEVMVLAFLSRRLPGQRRGRRQQT